jgi:biotin carboxylase
MAVRVAVVDGFSTGRFLVQELLDRGVECVHVRSKPRLNSYYESTFQPGDYVLDLGFNADVPALARLLAELDVERIVPGTESGVELADRLTHLTGTPGNVLELAGARRNKYLMAKTLRAAALDAPRSELASSPTEAVTWFEASGLDAVVVKPVNSAGSDHVRVCRRAIEVAEACADVLSAANLFGEPNRTALVQEFLSGPEFYANTVSDDGRHVIVETWRYTKTRTAKGAPVFDFEEPADLDAPEAMRIHDYVRSALTALGVRTGAAHSEVVLTARGPVLIDPGARLGGGVLPWVTAKLVGQSHAGVLADSVAAPERLTRLAEELPLRWKRPIRYVSLINHRAGRVSTLDWVWRIKALPTVIAMATPLAKGDKLVPTHDLLSSPGFVYLNGDSRHEIERDYEKIRSWEEAGCYTT